MYICSANIGVLFWILPFPEIMEIKIGYDNRINIFKTLYVPDILAHDNKLKKHETRHSKFRRNHFWIKIT